MAPRTFHAIDDEDKITSWKQDLVRVLHNFNQCTFEQFCWHSPLIVVPPFQTEIAIDAHTMVAGVRRKAFPGQENSVCQTFCPLTTEYLSSPRLKSGQGYRIQRVLSPYKPIASPLVNYLPRRQGLFWTLRAD